jgi:abortive infection bacteriophage resistance protein
MEYDKPHLTFRNQVELMQSRGLSIADAERAEHLLERVGYYRFSAYTYPLRTLLPASTPRETTVQFRGSQFHPNASFDLAEQLWAFDRRLRLLVLDALESVEIALRVRLAYVLGRTSAFAHLNRDALDAGRTGVDAIGDSNFDRWQTSYQRVVAQAAMSEDFIKHYQEKYDGKLPIWVAVEVLDFGMATSLFGLATQRDQTDVARAFGVRSGRTFEKWLKTFNYLRNVSAHHARLWNRTLTYGIARIPEGLADGLSYLDSITGRQRRKLYVPSAALAYVVRTIDEDSDWPTRFVDLMGDFPESELVSLERDMGFRAGWSQQWPWVTLPPDCSPEQRG